MVEQLEAHSNAMHNLWLLRNVRGWFSIPTATLTTAASHHGRVNMDTVLRRQHGAQHNQVNPGITVLRRWCETHPLTDHSCRHTRLPRDIGFASNQIGTAIINHWYYRQLWYCSSEPLLSLSKHWHRLLHRTIAIAVRTTGIVCSTEPWLSLLLPSDCIVCR